MGTFALYTFESGIYLLAGYLIYKWLLSAENQPAFNRFVLLSIYAVALVAPFFRGPEIAHLAGHTPAPLVEVGAVEAHALPGSGHGWMLWCVVAYFVGVILAALITAISFLRLYLILRSGERSAADGYCLVLMRHSKFATFSWMHYIVMSRDDFCEGAGTILVHERAHLRLRHWIDLLLAQIVVIILWYNPAAWLMRAELRNVHEYQADDAVLQCGADVRQYQLLLTKKAVGQRFPSLANSLNHSKLKNRITMMCNQKSSPARRLRALAIAPAILLAAVAVNTPSVASALGMASSVSFTGNKGSENNPVLQAAKAPEATSGDVQDKPETMPEYPGGMPEMFKFLADNMRYPAEAAAKGIEGRVLVKFIVNSRGNVSDISVEHSVSPELDAEAIRVVSIMPTWKPATTQGKAVDCSMVLPVNYKLPKEKKVKAKPQSATSGDTIDAITVVAHGKAESK